MIGLGIRAWVVVFVVLLALGGMGVALDRIILPEREKTRRAVFEQSQTYTHGKINQLNRLRVDYARANDNATRCALRGVALHEAAVATRLPDDLGAWVNTLREDSTCE